MEDGLRAMDISSLHPDSMKEEQSQRDIIKKLTRGNIHISAIQETHITQEMDYLLDNYRVTAESAAIKEETGIVQEGTSIMTHESMQQYVTQIS